MSPVLVHPVGPPTAAVTWREDGARLTILRPPTVMDRVRVGLAVGLTAAAVGFFVVGLRNPGAVGFAGRGSLLLLAGPALVLAAVLHLVLIVTGIRRPIAEFSATRVRVHGMRMAPAQVTGAFLQRNPASGSGDLILMVGTTVADLAPAVALLPPCALCDGDLQMLLAAIQTRLAARETKNQEPGTEN